MDELLIALLNSLLLKQFLSGVGRVDHEPPRHQVVKIASCLGEGHEINQQALDYLLDFHGGQRFVRNPLPHVIRSRIASGPMRPDPEDPREDVMRIIAHELLRYIHDQELQVDTPGRRRLRICENCKMFYFSPKGRPQTRFCGRSCVNSAGEKKRRKAAAGKKAATTTAKKKTRKKAGKTTGRGKTTTKPARKSAKKATKKKGG